MQATETNASARVVAMLEAERAATTKAMAKTILERAEHYAWEVPANGRLTLVLEPNVAVINVFHAKYRQPGTTAIHSHTVDFRSDIVGGGMRQYRYQRGGGAGARRFWEQELTLGGKLAGAPKECWLREGEIETYAAGEFYEITANEIHQSVPEDGTVTLITRQYRTNPMSVSTFWEWSPMAEGAKPSDKIIPGEAKEEVVKDVIGYALDKWF